MNLGHNLYFVLYTFLGDRLFIANAAGHTPILLFIVIILLFISDT